jgi:hypothetical protein
LRRVIYGMAAKAPRLGHRQLGTPV